MERAMPDRRIVLESSAGAAFFGLGVYVLAGSIAVALGVAVVAWLLFAAIDIDRRDHAEPDEEPEPTAGACATSSPAEPRRSFASFGGGGSGPAWPSPSSRRCSS